MADGEWVKDTEGLATVGAYNEGMNRPGNDRVYITLNSVLGEARHQLTIEEMPRHTHASNGIYATTPGSGTTVGVAVSGGAGAVNWYGGNPNETGNSYDHNNVQPSIGVYRWHRIA